MGVGLGLSESPAKMANDPFVSTSSRHAPKPTELTRDMVFALIGARLSPPSAAIRPVVTPAEAWMDGRLPGASTYVLVLADWSSGSAIGPAVPKRLLVWLIFGTHIEETNLRTGVTVSAAGMVPVDASTGQVLGTLEFPSGVISDLHADLRPYLPSK